MIDILRIKVPLLMIVINLIILAWALLLIGGCDKQETLQHDHLPAIRIKVLNGCGFRKAASEMRDHLLQHNIDVISVGNADNFIYNRTIIVVKKDDKQDLDRLMNYTNIKRRIYALCNDSVESFQIIVGKDYRTYMD